jgi:hypothetical protein
MPTNRRKREIRKLMAETGLNYTAAMREHDRRREAANEEPTHQGEAVQTE